MIDLCVTALIKNHDPFMPHFGSHKWSSVAELDCFYKVREPANTAFEYMDEQGHHIPEIVRHSSDGIAMSWTDEERIVTIILDPNGFSYRWGKQGASLPTYSKAVQKLPEMLDLFAKYLNRTIEVDNDATGSDEVQDRSGSRQERDPGPVGPVQRRLTDRDCGCCE
jgi:hypothetical protein